MNQNIAAAKDDDEIVFKIKRSAIADALRSDFEMPIPVTDANIEVVVNQITALIDEFPTGVPTEFFDLGIDHHKGIDFYRRIYDLLGDINGPCCGTAWASEDSSLVYFAVADEADGLIVRFGRQAGIRLLRGSLSVSRGRENQFQRPRR